MQRRRSGAPGGCAVQGEPSPASVAPPPPPPTLPSQAEHAVLSILAVLRFYDCLCMSGGERDTRGPNHEKCFDAPPPLLLTLLPAAEGLEKLVHPRPQAQRALPPKPA